MLPRPSTGLVEWALAVRSGGTDSEFAIVLSPQDRVLLRAYYQVAAKMFGWGQESSRDDTAWLIVWKSGAWWRRFVPWSPWAIREEVK